MSLLGSIGKALSKVLGLDNDDAAKRQEEALRRQQEQAKLEAANEIENVTQFDEGTDPSFAVDPNKRRKKRSTGAYASGIGLQI
ncbi:hypothetical protein [Vibrio phage vB_VhaP_VH-5]|uniref:Uncharacterized protein n=1 Tax=Vibrio phage vB_VhaP_VH-5 TaxID=2660694 RepID=A0A5Q2WCK5_9CAUD|nr:hypothetical protein [Vibrio phage vB_VhaP_VH-5]